MIRKRNYTIECAECETEFAAFRPSDRFCSMKCRSAFNNRDRNKEVKAAYHKRWANVNSRKRRDYHYTRMYGIALEQYEDLLEEQGHACAICHKPNGVESKSLAVDHDHKTGEIFGLLCFSCNHMLIGKNRRPNIYYAAAKYLEQGTGLVVPPEAMARHHPRRKRKTK